MKKKQKKENACHPLLKPKDKECEFNLKIKLSVLFLSILQFGVRANDTYVPKAEAGLYLKSLYSINVLQERVTGKVTDSHGTPLSGANVIVKGSISGTQTDFDGNYDIVTESKAILVFSYIGFKTKEIAINGQSSINVTMFEDTSYLDKVVVMGYTSQTRGDVTGSVASVDISEAVKAPIVNAAEMLEGRVTGVTVTNNGNPGRAPKITVRGFGTSNNTNPLYIIDGIQTDNPSILNSINPNDIEQINVLKDASAAIYGARASNGVIIIITKSGRYNMDKAIISVDGYYGFSNAFNLPKLLNIQQHADMIWKGLANDKLKLTHPQYGIGPNPVIPSKLTGYTRVVSYNPIVRGDASATVTPGGTNWLKEITRVAPMQSASISMQNGTETGKYFMSVNYLNQEGILLTTGFKQGISRLNSEFKLHDKIRIGQRLSASFSNTSEGNTINDALRSSPLIPVYDDKGRLAGTGAKGTGNSRSPIAQLLRKQDDYNKLLRVFGNVYLSAEIYNGITIKTDISGNIESLNTRQFQALDPEHGEPLGTNTLTEQNNNNYSWVWSNSINYNKIFGRHSLNILAGIEFVKNGNREKKISRNGFLFENPEYYLLSNGSGTPNVNNATGSSNSLFSIFGNANYSYQGKYFATATLRKDKTSRFLGANKSDIFPSFSLGWLVSKEDFFPQNTIIDRLKIKGSWGQLGNQTLPVNNPTINISKLSENLGNYALDGSTISTGAILSDVGNPNLKWETSETTNFGVEFGLFDGLSVEFEYFNIKTKNLITRDNSLISTTAIDAKAPLVNLGSVKNTGFDLSINYNRKTDFGLSYSILANISRYKNKVTELISEFQPGRTNLRGGAVTRTGVGSPISSFYGRVVTGFNDVGRFTYKDIDNNGIINDKDREYIGSPHPDFTYGINLRLEYKKFDISTFISGSKGNDIYNYEKIFTDFPTFVDGNRSFRVLDSWTPANTNATLPALSNSITNSETQPNSYFVEDGSYLRMKNLQLGYSFDKKLTEKIGLHSLHLYIRASNLFVITAYNGFDPEVISNDNLSLGIDFGTYPTARILTFGFNLKL